MIHIIGKIWFCCSYFQISDRRHLIMYATSITSFNAKASVVSVLLTTCFNFADSQIRSVYLLSLPSKYTSSLSFELLCFKFANDVLLKQVKAAFSMSSIFGNDKTASLNFNILMNLLAVIKFLTLASLIEVLTGLAAYAIPGLVWEDTQFSWPVTLCSCWASWVVVYVLSDWEYFWWIQIYVFFYI